MVSNVIVGIVGFGISGAVAFFLTPYLANEIGKQAIYYSTVSLQVINYLGIFVTSATAIIIREAIVNFKTGDADSLQITKLQGIKYLTKFCLGSLIIISICIVNLDCLLSIEDVMSKSVQSLFVYIILGFYISVVADYFAIATYINNQPNKRVYIDVVKSILRGILLIMIFTLFGPKLEFIGIVYFIVQIIGLIYYYYNLADNWKPWKNQSNLGRLSQYSLKLNNESLMFLVNSLAIMIISTSLLWVCNSNSTKENSNNLAIAYIIPSLFSGVITVISNILTTRVVSAGLKTKEIYGKHLITMQLLMSAIVIPGIVTIILLFDEFLHLWMPLQYSKEITVFALMQFMILSVHANSWIIYNATYASNQIAIPALFNALFAIVYVLYQYLTLDSNANSVRDALIFALSVNVAQYLVVIPKVLKSKIDVVQASLYIPTVITIILLISAYWGNNVLSLWIVNDWLGFFVKAIVVLFLSHASYAFVGYLIIVSSQKLLGFKLHIDNRLN